MNFQCFGLVINGYDLNRIKQEILTRVSLNRQTWIVTANPEILLYAKKHTDYWEALRQAELRTVDGFGLKLAGFLRGARPKRVTGVSLAEMVVKLCKSENWTLLLLGGQEGSADKSAWELRKRYPEIKIFTDLNDCKISPYGIMEEKDENSISRLVEYEPDVILVGFGHPKQEFWINRYKDKFPNAKLFIGVGGTFDFWSHKIKRAPKFIQKLGLEWLWRLIMDPRRLKRIWNAVIVFPIKFLFNN